MDKEVIERVIRDAVQEANNRAEDAFEEAQKDWCVGTSGNSNYEKSLAVAQAAAVKPEDYQHNFKKTEFKN